MGEGGAWLYEPLKMKTEERHQKQSLLSLMNGLNESGVANWVRVDAGLPSAVPPNWLCRPGREEQQKVSLEGNKVQSRKSC